MVIVADDEEDYEAVLGSAGISDPRLRFCSSGGIGRGEGAARNAGLGMAREPLIALLDADDLFAPTRVEALVAGLLVAPLVSTAVTVVDAQGKALRTVGAGESGMVRAADYKWRHVTGDSVLAWNRDVWAPGYDESLRFLCDLDFLMRMFCRHGEVFYIGAPLYLYVKHPSAASSRPDVALQMTAAKAELLDRLGRGHYSFADRDAAAGLSAFLTRSMAAEQSFAEAGAQEPGLTFETHLERHFAGGWRVPAPG